MVAADGSQSGEVEALRALIGADWPPALVDVGAYDGSELSNSRPFLEAGWRGVLVEPQPEPFAACEARYAGRPDVTCLNVACADEPGRRPLYLGAGPIGPMLSTLCTDDNDWFRENRTDASIEVPVETLTAILDRDGFPADFSLLLVDAEGMDHEVLLGLDWTRYRPRVVVTEEYEWNPEKHAAKYALLERLGYALRATIGSNTLWLAR